MLDEAVCSAMGRTSHPRRGLTLEELKELGAQVYFDDGEEFRAHVIANELSRLKHCHDQKREAQLPGAAKTGPEF